MALDGVLLKRITNIMNDNVPVKIIKINQPSNHEFVFQCFAGKKINLFISTHPLFSRIQWTHEKTSANLDQTHMLVLMRKHLDGGIITKIEQYGFDRVIELHIEHRDDMGVIRPYRLIIELLGKYANVIIVNDVGLIIDALKRISPFENSQRAIVAGGEYDYPPQFDKKDFTELSTYDPHESLSHQFNGISPLLEKEILYRLKSQDPQSIVDEIMTSNTLYIYKNDYHILELKHLNQEAVEKPIMEGLDEFYRDLQERDRVKAHTGDLLKLIRRELKRSKQKLPKLYDDLDKALDCDHLREKGDLLFAFASNNPKGNDSITLNDFEGNEVVVDLDPRYGGKDNARLYFKKYNKAKTSLMYLEDQIQKTEARIEYFENLYVQTEQATVEDAQEITEELLNSGIINQRRLKQSKQQKKKKKPNYTVLQYDDETTIYIGKNNIQNEAITFKVARKDDIWFHAAYTGGAHVLIKTPELDEPKLRLCAQLAAYFSKNRLGSSVEIHYTQAKNIKKIPGAAPGLVSLGTHKGMFIDPDETYILHSIDTMKIKQQ